MELFCKIDGAILASDRATAGVRRGEALMSDVRARRGWELAELLGGLCLRTEEARVGIDLKTSAGTLRVALDGGVCVCSPDGNWLLPVEVDEEENCLRVRDLLLEVLEAALTSPEEAEVKVYPV